jgi:hypothetical protein
MNIYLKHLHWLHLYRIEFLTCCCSFNLYKHYNHKPAPIQTGKTNHNLLKHLKKPGAILITLLLKIAPPPIKKYRGFTQL